MRRLLLTAVLVGTATTVGTQILAAQSADRPPRIERGEPVRIEMTDHDRLKADLDQPVYLKEFSFHARAGERPAIYVASDVSGGVGVYRSVPRTGEKAYIMGAGADLETECEGEFAPGWRSGQYKICIFKKPLQQDSEIRITVGTRRPGEVLLAGYGESNNAGFEALMNSMPRPVSVEATPRSRTSGIQLSFGFAGSRFEGERTATESGTGPAAHIGIAFSEVFALVAEGGMLEMSPEGDGYTVEDEYVLYQADFGGRLYLLGSGSWLRAYLQGTYGIRRMDLYEDVEAAGVAITPGAGFQLFVTPSISLEGGVRRSSVEINRARQAGGEWIDIPEDNVVKGPTTRLNLQMAVHF